MYKDISHWRIRVDQGNVVDKLFDDFVKMNPVSEYENMLRILNMEVSRKAIKKHLRDSLILEEFNGTISLSDVGEFALDIGEGESFLFHLDGDKEVKG